MESNVFDVVKFEKEKAIARFNRFRKIVKLWQTFEILVVLGLISWSSACVPVLLKVVGRCFIEFSTCLFNHHVVFLIGNAIIVLLFVLCRRNDTANPSVGGGDFYDDYIKHSEATHERGPVLTPTPYSSYAEGSSVEEKQIVVCTEEAVAEAQIVVCTEEAVAEAVAIPQCDEVKAAIEKARRQIKKFQRTQSEKLRREIAVRPQLQLQRSESENRQKAGSWDQQFNAAEIERLSSDEFRRTVDAFIDKHWSKKKTEKKKSG
ncbi:hypothetical protein CDL12_03857 [Handroanthus impetiginosus]|uniref:DUF4408 domain-containing protein n=1 Tax=Handroanthus impetiginosus TaxID=429701 RepID=A0A2G9I1D9_9LAMI|nr:hypothetical protein CDL12_03857 [Handroanthus impetiginosus]